MSVKNAKSARQRLNAAHCCGALVFPGLSGRVTESVIRFLIARLPTLWIAARRAWPPAYVNRKPSASERFAVPGAARKAVKPADVPSNW